MRFFFEARREHRSKGGEGQRKRERISGLDAGLSLTTLRS